ncbi:unnamed protein product [Sphagnum jensenii]
MGHVQIMKILVERPEVEIAWALHGAARNGHRGVVEELLNSGKEVRVNTLNQEILDDAQNRSSFGEKFNPLHLASIYGHTSVVQALCEDRKRRLEVNNKSDAGVTAVQMAARMGHVQIVKILLERPEVEIAWALHAAAKNGHRGVVEKLLNSEKEVHVNALKQEILDDAQDRSSFGEEFNPLHLASVYGHASVVQALCEDNKRRLQVNIESKPAGVTAVQMAAEMGHVEIMKILLERPEVEIAWALHGAAKNGHHGVVEELLSSGKEVRVNTLKHEILDDAQNRSSFGEKFSPLHLASIYGHASVVQALCGDRKRRLEVNNKSDVGVRAIQMAVQMGHVPIVKILLETPEVEIAWALHGAAKNGHRGMVEELLNSKKEIRVNTLKHEILDDAQDRSSFGEEFNPLHLASIYGHASIVQALCEDKKRRLQVNIESKPVGMTAVQMAARMGHVQIVKILLQRPEVDITWALHGAARNGHRGMVEELLNSGKEVRVNTLKQEILDDAQDRSSFGEEFNPLHLASIYGHASVVEALCGDRKRRLQVNIESKPTGVTAVQMAARMGHAQIVKILLQRPEVDIAWAVHAAAKNGHHGVVEELLLSEKEVHVNTLKHEILDDAQNRSSFGEKFTPLHLASIYGHASVVQALCGDRKRRLQVNSESKLAGVTAVQMAAWIGDVQIVKILLERPEVDIAWALHAAAGNGHCDVVEELLNSEKEVPVNTLKQEILDDAQNRSSFGEKFTPLHLASIYGHANVVRALCDDRKRRLQVNIESKPTGVTAVQMVAEMGHVPIVKILMERSEVEIAWALHGAARNGHHDVVEELLNSGKEVPVNTLKHEILDDAQNRSSFGEKFNPLHLASIYGHANVVQALCEDKKRCLQVNIESKPTGVTAVQMAARMGHVQIVKILLEIPEVDVASALHGAARNGHRGVVEELLNSGKEVRVNTLKQEILDDAQDRSSFGEEFNPLHLASIYGHASVVQTLCEDNKRRLQVNIESKPAGVTAVQMAAEMGHVEIMKSLLERPEVEIAWALHGAAKNGHHGVVEELLNSGKEVRVNTLKHEILDDAQNRSSFGEKFSPLHLASISGHASVVQALCGDRKRRLEVNNKSDVGVTAIQMAVQMGHVLIVKILLETPEVEIAWALHGAAKNGHCGVVELLLNSEKEVFVNTLKQEILDDAQDRSSFGEEFNPLHLASIYGHASVVQALCEDRKRRLQVNIESKPAGVTAVQMAAEMGHVEIMKILLERPEVEIAWALHGAAKNGHHGVVEELLNSGKEVRVNTLKHEILDDAQNRSSFGEKFSPLHLASIYGHASVVQALCGDRKRRLEVNIKSDVGVRAIQMAVQMGHVPIVKILLETPEVEVAWALHGAAKNGHCGVVEELLNSEKEVFVNTLKREILDDGQDRSSFGEEFNPLHLASIYGHASVVQALCEDRKRRLQVNIESKPAGVTAVQMAAEMGHVPIVKILMERSKVEITWALHGAARNGHHGVVEELLNSGKEVDVNTLKQEILDDAQNRSSFGEKFNPLHLASIYGHASVVEALCGDRKRRLQVNIESDAGVTAVQMAAQMGHVQIVKILLEIPEVKIAWALHGAAKNGHRDVVEKLLNSGKEVDVNTLKLERLDDTQDRSSFGEEFNPLHLASIYRHVGVVQVLCEQKTLRANMESGAGMTAVQIAIRGGYAEIEKILLDRTDVQKHLDRLYRDRQVHVDAANAILVGATLIASVTFAAWLQPPLGYSEFYGSTSIDVGAPLPSGMYPSFVSVAGHPVLDIFWIFNSMSFLFAIATLMVGANAARPPRQGKYIGEVVQTLRTLLSLAYNLLTVSIGCVLGAFACAGFVVLPPVRRYTVTMGATLGIGLVVVLLSWTSSWRISSWRISSWISSKVLYVLKIIKECFCNNP